MTVAGATVAVNVTGWSKVAVSAAPDFADVDHQPTVPIDRYEWTFGDGTMATTTGNIVNHVYREAGTAVVEVTVFTVEGDRGSTQMTLIVVDTGTLTPVR